MSPTRFTRLADWLAWQETLHPKAIELGLDRVQRVLERTGWRRPNHPFITVGGTNGKGSCVALLDSILCAAGYRVGTFTSPHLQQYNERIRIAGGQIDDASLIAAFERIDAARGSDTLTFFEFNTLAALLVYETVCLDVAVLEVGMGGRLDAVNVVDADVALVTSVALDHCEWLGSDVETIGYEKAGIFRSGRPAIFGSRKMPRSIGIVARNIGASLHRLGREFDFAREGDTWSWTAGEVTLKSLPPPTLTGEIQYANAAAVIAVLQKLSGLPVARSALEAGLRDVRLGGRFEVRSGEVNWIFDVAHNPEAAQMLAGNLSALPSGGRTFAVCGVLGDKDVESIVAAMQSVIDIWILAMLPGPRAASPTELVERVTRAGVVAKLVAPDVASACMAARELAQPGDRIVVFGSFLTVGAARQWHAKRGGG